MKDSKMTSAGQRLRRRILAQGAAAAVSAGCAGSLHLPQLLAAESQPGRGRTERSCIFIFQYGGLSQLDSWDPKPHAPSEIRGPYRPIATRTPGFQVGELMPALATRSDKYCVIRSLSHRVPVHNIANEMLLAGASQPRSDSPSIGSIVTRLSPSTENVPSHVWLQKFGGGAAPAEPAYLTGGFLGMDVAPMLLGERHDDNPGTLGYRVRAFEPTDDLTDHRRHNRRHLLETLQHANLECSAVQRMTQMQHRAFDILNGSQARHAFDLEAESESLRDRYGRHPFGQNLLLARRLIESGVRLVNVVAWMGMAPSEKFVSVETWDMHGNAGVGIFDNGWNGLGWAMPRADQAVAALLDDLEQRGLLDSTLVVFVGEFGRTPAISRGASAMGRDHWPNCYSGMLAGCGIPGGLVYGESDDTAAWVRDSAVSPDDLGATILASLGLDPSTRLSPDGFTRPASTGQPLPFVPTA